MKIERKKIRDFLIGKEFNNFLPKSALRALDLQEKYQKPLPSIENVTRNLISLMTFLIFE